MARPTLYLIIPVYNEERNIGGLTATIEKLAASVGKEFVPHVVFVNDGSRDGTARAIQLAAPRFACTVLSHDRNLGPGAAFATAFRHLSGMMDSCDWVLTMEGDNTSELDTIMHMLVRRKEGYDVVLASPYLYGGGFSRVHFHRLFISHAANSLVKLLLGLRGIQTFSCFLRLYNAYILQKLQRVWGPAIISSRGFECMVELLAKLTRAHAKISEVELMVDWSKRAGKSKLRLFRTIAGYMRLFLQSTRSGLRGT